MKTAPLLRRKVSKYTSQCDQGNITVVVCVIRISLCNKEKLFICLALAKPAPPGQFKPFGVIPEQGKCIEMFLFVPMHSTK
jgi:hypothetical protein